MNHTIDIFVATAMRIVAVILASIGVKAWAGGFVPPAIGFITLGIGLFLVAGFINVDDDTEERHGNHD